MGQTHCLCSHDRPSIKKNRCITDRDSITAYSSYGQNQILKDQVRIMIIGTKSAGKTTLMNKLIIDNFKKEQNVALKQLPHGGIQFRNISINLGDIHTQNSIQCRFLDVEGDFLEEFDIIKLHINSCDGFILMTDIANPSSAEDASKILQELSKYSTKKPLLLLANKCESGEFGKEKTELENLASTYDNCKFSACSVVESQEYVKSIQQIVFSSAKINISTPK